MVRAINKVMQGGKYFSADIAEQLASSYLSDTQQSLLIRYQNGKCKLQ